MTFDVENKTVLVTGANRGTGNEVGRQQWKTNRSGDYHYRWLISVPGGVDISGDTSDKNCIVAFHFTKLIFESSLNSQQESKADLGDPFNSY